VETIAYPITYLSAAGEALDLQAIGCLRSLNPDTPEWDIFPLQLRGHIAFALTWITGGSRQGLMALISNAAFTWL